MKLSRQLIAAIFVILPALGFAQAQLMKPLDPPFEAPAFELMDIDDQVYRLAQYKGQPLIINFWATWCPPCREEMPSMERAWQKVKNEGIVLLGINVGEDDESVFAFGAEYDLSFPLLLDTDGSVTKKWPIRGLPTTYVVDAEGQVIYQAIGGRPWDDEGLLDQVRALHRK